MKRFLIGDWLRGRWLVVALFCAGLVLGAALQARPAAAGSTCPDQSMGSATASLMLYGLNSCTGLTNTPVINAFIAGTIDSYSYGTLQVTAYNNIAMVPQIIEGGSPQCGVSGNQIKFIQTAICRVQFTGTESSGTFVTITALLNFKIPQDKFQLQNISISGGRYDVPYVTQIFPASGTAGSQIVVTGRDFSTITGVNIGSTAVSAFTQNGDSLQFTVPSLTPGDYYVNVTNSVGTSPTNSLHSRFTYYDPPTIASVSPSSGLQGNSVTVTGANFGTSPQVSFNGSPATVTQVSTDGTSANVTVPSGAGTVDVTVAANGLSATKSNAFTYTPIVTGITGVSQNRGPAAGGNQVVISGSSFSGVTGVTFGTTPALSFSFINDGSISAVAPAGTGTVDVRVTTSLGGTSASGSADQYIYVQPPVATTSIPTVILEQNVETTAVTPVSVTGGLGNLTYTIDPALPDGLTLSDGTGAISGAPTVAVPQATYTITVTDANHDQSSSTFLLTVNSPLTAIQTISETVVDQFQNFTPFTPVTVSGGIFPHTYSIGPALPAGISMAPATGLISGSSVNILPRTTYTVTVTGANGSTASNTFDLVINTAVDAVQAAPSETLTQNQPSASFKPVNGTGGTLPLSYQISPHLPDGLTFEAATGVITGSPAVTHATSTFTVLVTDANGQTASNTFQLTVNNAVTATQAVGAVSLTAGHAATPFTPVIGGIGTGTLTFSISPSLPSGLTLDTGNGQISGTPTALSPATNYTVTVTDTNGATASNSFDLTVSEPVTATQMVPATALTQGAAAAPFTPVTGAGGTGSLSFSISPALPAGLNWDPGNGQITGTATITSAATTYTVTVRDANGATASNTFVLSVNSAVTATQAVPSTTLTANHVASPFTPVTGGGGTGALTYRVSPDLPGLQLDTSTGQISGTPSSAATASTYTITVTDTNGASASNTFSLAINSAVAATQSLATTVLTQNHAPEPFTPVTGAGGTGALTYAVMPSLPTGLVYNTANGQITGAPTVASAAGAYTVTVSDANGATATNTFSLTVNGAVTAAQAIASKSLTVTVAITPFTPVTGGGGTGTLSYQISPALPAGLAFDTSNGRVSGTPTIVSAAAHYTVTVTDANSATASDSFQLEVAAIAQTITFTSTPPKAHIHSPDYMVTATGGTSGEPIVFSLDATSGAGVCSIAGNIVSFLAAGSCVIDANQQGNADYAPAAQAQQMITVVATDIAAVTKAIGGFLSDRGNQIVSNQADFSGHGIDRLNEAAGQNGNGSSGFTDQGLVPASGRPDGALAAPAGLAIAGGAGGMQDLWGLQAMLRDAMQNAGQSGSMDRFTYSGPFNATVNAHDGFAASFHTSLSQLMKWQEAALGVNGSGLNRSPSYSPFDIWMEGTYGGYSGNRSGQFGLFTIGSDYVINPNVLIGVFTQIDTMNQTSGTAISGTGWMAGPYATVRVTDQMFWTSRAGWGRSGNSLSGSGDFASTRWLASTALAGKWQFGHGFTFSPDLGFTYFQDYTEAYQDTFGIAIPGVKTELGQLKLSPQVSYGFITDSGLWIEPSIAPELIWNLTSTNVDGLGALSDTATGPTGLRGRLKAGLAFRTPQGISISAFGSYDGIGSTGYSAIAAQANVMVPLN